MKGSSFGAIYDAFDGFEQQMEDALDGIFNEDVTPGITAVAASVTQSFRLSNLSTYNKARCVSCTSLRATHTARTAHHTLV